MHKDPTRKAAYLKRHAKDPHNAVSAGELSRTLLWNKPTLKQSAQDFQKKHGVKVVI